MVTSMWGEISEISPCVCFENQFIYNIHLYLDLLSTDVIYTHYIPVPKPLC